ncbi:hypothetical protein [Tepidiforma thermophila]|uniref:Uncharacterized protein n=1 Tax=Tepidiforma thermophila (strain KCTC 52669 / CGMCC 1.13589 / G233) TaxID=2761530 RepID=A0A2A9HEU6_TEPT2|nr:hypothetical protein [Tepidiforma thermophila]PFG73506.1 hypothetical protein A9A59_0704 [Tepidiforma thermophila]
MTVRTMAGFPLQGVARVLLVSLLPMLSFFGHWPALAVPIPGTGIELQLPFSGPVPGDGGTHDHADGHAHAPGDHEAHCHAEMATCAETQVGGQAPVTVLLETVLQLLGAGAWVAFAACAALAPRPADPAGIDPPPRTPLLIAAS